jgi:hypothetical protein
MSNVTANPSVFPSCLSSGVHRFSCISVPLPTKCLPVCHHCLFDESTTWTVQTSKKNHVFLPIVCQGLLILPHIPHHIVHSVLLIRKSLYRASQVHLKPYICHNCLRSHHHPCRLPKIMQQHPLQFREERVVSVDGDRVNNVAYIAASSPRQLDSISGQGNGNCSCPTRLSGRNICNMWS